MDAATLLARLTEVSVGRAASALIADPEHTMEVSVGADGRWVVRSWATEWSFGPDGLTCWQLIPAGGAAKLPHSHPEGWVHPVVGLLRPDLLPVWGRVPDLYRPIAIIDGVAGPAQVVLAPSRTEAHVGTLHVDARRWLCTALELPGLSWTLTEYLAW